MPINVVPVQFMLSLILLNANKSCPCLIHPYDGFFQEIPAKTLTEELASRRNVGRIHPEYAIGKKDIPLSI
jgi:hypothetical protein